MVKDKMTMLINKIERRLGTAPLQLPKELNKDMWVTIIEEETLPTFSRYFPHMVRIMVNTSRENMTKDGYFLIDEDVIGNTDIIGIRDIAFDQFGQDSLYLQQSAGLGIYDFVSTAATYSMDDVMLLQTRANMTSMFNNQIYVDFQLPNKVKLSTVCGAEISRSVRNFPLDVYVTHPTNLMTISPTQFETFEKLAIADVAGMLYEYLKHYDGIETVFANVDLKLDSLATKAGMREEVIQKLEESYVNPANVNQPMIICV